MITDVVITEKNDAGESRQVSAKDKESFEQTESYRNLMEAQKIVEEGGLVVLVSCHNSYSTGPLIPYALRRSGFNGLADKLETLIGPRVLADWAKRLFAGMSGITLLVKPHTGKNPRELNQILKASLTQVHERLKEEIGRVVLLFPSAQRDAEMQSGEWKMGEVTGSTLGLFPQDTYFPVFVTIFQKKFEMAY